MTCTCVLSRASAKEAADDVDRMAPTGFAVEAVKKKAQCGISTGDMHAVVAHGVTHNRMGRQTRLHSQKCTALGQDVHKMS
jgi:uncharacterized protein YoaH (UPF0181 family)